MSALLDAKGSCLCGAVGVTVKKMNKDMGACHCSMCRKWAGGPLFAVDCGTEVSFTGEENISVFSSSDWAERAFCAKCGSHLFYRLKQSGQYMMAVGLFEDDKNFVFEHQVFIDEKPAFYSFANETKNMTGAELFALYAPPAE